jgi:uncharacterized ion transporter superfamily protein YfcC
MIYAWRIKRNPELSPVYEYDKKKRENITDYSVAHARFTTSSILVMITFAVAMVVLVVGVMNWGWYIKEICGLFVAVAIISGIVGRIGANNIAKHFAQGAAELCGAAIVVGLARGILVVAKDGKIIDTILHSLAGLVADVHSVFSAWLMFLVQTVINFFIPSGSGQAALTIPIMAPLGDLIGVSRQITVLAYQFGDGFTNLIIPTSGVLIGCLYMAKIPWGTWAKWMLPLQLIFIALGCALLGGAVAIGFGP